MPHTGGHLDILPGDLPTDPSHDLVESNIAFERVRPHDVIIEVILSAYDEPGGLVHHPVDRFELGRYFYIFSDESVVETEWEAVVGGVATGLRNHPAARRGRILQYLPTDGVTLAGQPLSKAKGCGADWHGRKIDGHCFPPYLLVKKVR